MNKNLIIEKVNNNPNLTSLILTNAILINKSNAITNPVALLQALAMKESTYGSNNKRRYESAYGPGGTYYQADHVKNLYYNYGRDAACSWSSFQIMFITAYELGYRGVPSDLQSDYIAIEWVIKYINNRILKFEPKSIEQVFDAYNSGSFRDSYIPIEYVKACMEYYEFFTSKEYNEIKTGVKKYEITEELLDNTIKYIQERIKELHEIEISLLMLKG